MAEAAQNMAAEDAEWLRQLEAPRGRDGALMCVARWHTNEQLALVEREKGSDMHVFGVYKQGQLWLSAEETLCLVEDGLLELVFGEAGAPPLSVQRATHELLGRGGASAARKYAVFTHLHRHGFVCRPTALESGCQFPLFEVRHRRGYSRRAVEAGSQPPLFIAAIFDATAQMPPVRELQARPPLRSNTTASPPAPFHRSARELPGAPSVLTGARVAPLLAGARPPLRARARALRVCARAGGTLLRDRVWGGARIWGGAAAAPNACGLRVRVRGGRCGRRLRRRPRPGTVGRCGRARGQQPPSVASSGVSLFAATPFAASFAAPFAAAALASTIATVSPRRRRRDHRRRGRRGRDAALVTRQASAPTNGASHRRSRRRRPVSRRPVSRRRVSNQLEAGRRRRGRRGQGRDGCSDRGRARKARRGDAALHDACVAIGRRALPALPTRFGRE